VPDNLELEFWDLNQPLTSTYRSNSFDLIHSRCVGPGIKKGRWSSYIRDLARLLKRGGWVQMVEYYYNIQSDTGRLTDNHAMYKWGVTYRATMELIDRDPRIGRTLAEKLRNAGLHDVHSRTYQIPIGPWAGGEYDITPALKHTFVAVVRRDPLLFPILLRSSALGERSYSPASQTIRQALRCSSIATLPKAYLCLS
jgi:hypothetical protein